MRIYRILMLVIKLSIIGSLALLFPSDANCQRFLNFTDDRDHVYCSQDSYKGDASSRERVTYFSDLFRGDYAEDYEVWENDFQDSLQHGEEWTIDGASSCHLDDNEGSRMSQAIENSQRYGREPIETGWFPQSLPYFDSEDQISIFCTVGFHDTAKARNRLVRYFSAPFYFYRADWEKSRSYTDREREEEGWRKDFRVYLENRYKIRLDSDREVYCRENKYHDKVYSEFRREILDAEINNWAPIFTGWTPEGVENDYSFERPLQDFEITVNSWDRSVRICIRDHECEDGDKVRVRVNGITIFDDHELFRENFCRTVSVNEGKNGIEFFAINGSGNKGDCNYADANTGQISVTGKDTQTQTWKYRGGAGSSANIVIAVR